MIMVQSRDGKVYQSGIDKLRELIEKRISPFAANLSMDTEIFDRPETRVQLCTMSGGHVREMMLLMQTSMDWTDDLPISGQAVQRAITEARNNTYRSAVDNEDWAKLAEVAVSKRIPNDDQYRDLLFRRCLLEYREVTPGGEIQRWHDIHPLIKDIDEFKDALKRIQKTRA